MTMHDEGFFLFMVHGPCSMGMGVGGC